MSRVLMCATPVYGHVTPMITIGRHLVRNGHQVRMLTGTRFAHAVTAAGIEAIRLPASCDYVEDIYASLPAGAELTGLRKLRFDVENVFIAVMSAQYQAVRAEILREPVDVVIGETALSRVVFARAHRLAQRQLRRLGVATLSCFALEATTLADDYLQLTCAGFEYPRRDLRPDILFVGPVLPASTNFTPPDWWPDLSDDRPVVPVTQGTIANSELGKLIGPTITALAQKNVLVIVTTGNEDTAEALRALAPAHVRVAAFVPYDELLDHVDVMITNGGYGGVQFALAHGVPLIVAGDTEEKPEIAARVAWTGAGINLRIGTPTSGAIGAASYGSRTKLTRRWSRTQVDASGHDL